MPRRRPGPGERPTGEGIDPRYRRAFGCVTWVNMAILAFLLAAFLLVLPFRYAGGGDIYSRTLLQLAFAGLVVILPGMAIGAFLGARTYRVERRLGLRAGAGIGAVAGLSVYLFFSLIQGLLAIPPIVSLGLLLYVLFSASQSLERRRTVLLVAAALAVLSGAGAFLLDFDLRALLGALVATVSAAFGGFVGGFGYARAGGDEMMPPGAIRRPPK